MAARKKSNSRESNGTLLRPDLQALMLLVSAGKYDNVEFSARNILNRNPNNSLALKALGFALLHQNRAEEALAIIDHALHLVPHDWELHNNKGIALATLLRSDEALACFECALRINTTDYEIWENFGKACQKMGKWADSIPAFLKAIEYAPDDSSELVLQLMQSLTNTRRYQEAWICASELNKLEPDNIFYLANVLTLGLMVGDWSDFDPRLSKVVFSLRNTSEIILNPFEQLYLPNISSSDQVSQANRYSRSAARFPEPIKSSGRFSTAVSPLRIGYLSSDFKNHPVSYVLSEVIEQHDRSRFTILAFSAAKDDGSAIRNRIVSAFDDFFDVSEMSIANLVDFIKTKEVDVLIDLNGWTLDTKIEVLAFRCAPVQMSWLGYASSLGRPGLADFIIGDPVVTPLSVAEPYPEKVINLPVCYMPADTRTPLGKKPLRSFEGLPENKFVYGSFNNVPKYNPFVFDLWGRILDSTSNSILWLGWAAQEIQDRLRAEMVKRGVAEDRILFAERRESRQDHIDRLQLIDFGLDPFPYNSHSTGVDLLWAGVPFVSLLGQTFAARVGVSLLKAAALDELVAITEEEYMAQAVRAYQDQSWLAHLKSRIAQRESLPLFDMVRFTRDLENAVEEAYAATVECGGTSA